MKTSPLSFKTIPAFTRLELLCVLTALSLLASVVLPGLANTKPRSERVVCVNNLRQVGRALQSWAVEHGDTNPWRLPVSLRGGGYDLDGGSVGHPLDNNAWFQFAWVSNHLGTPKILACPSDSFAKVAGDFGASPTTGFMHLGYQNSAVSYFINLDSFYDYPQLVLSGDRNVRMSGVATACSSGIVSVFGIVARPLDPQVAWINSLHGEEGNLLLCDGQVQQVSTTGLRAVLKASDGSAIHFLSRY